STLSIVFFTVTSAFLLFFHLSPCPISSLLSSPTRRSSDLGTPVPSPARGRCTRPRRRETVPRRTSPRRALRESLPPSQIDLRLYSGNWSMGHSSRVLSGRFRTILGW